MINISELRLKKEKLNQTIECLKNQRKLYVENKAENFYINTIKPYIEENIEEYFLKDEPIIKCWVIDTDLFDSEEAILYNKVKKLILLDYGEIIANRYDVVYTQIYKKFYNKNKKLSISIRIVWK